MEVKRKHSMYKFVQKLALLALIIVTAALAAYLKKQKTRAEYSLNVKAGACYTEGETVKAPCRQVRSRDPHWGLGPCSLTTAPIPDVEYFPRNEMLRSTVLNATTTGKEEKKEEQKQCANGVWLRCYDSTISFGAIISIPLWHVWKKTNIIIPGNIFTNESIKGKDCTVNGQ
jgi:hypothetical protein